MSERFLRASDLGYDGNNAEWKTICFDSVSKSFVIPNGSIGFRWNEEGRWNLHRRDSGTDEPVSPLMSYAEDNSGWASGTIPVFRRIWSRVQDWHCSGEKDQTRRGGDPGDHGV